MDEVETIVKQIEENIPQFFEKEELKLIHFADPRLKTPPAPFDFENEHPEKAQQLASLLYDKMLEFGGVGLSANQVGLNYRVFVFGNADNHTVMFNPTVVAVSKETSTMEEGCLSFPGFFLTLKRPRDVVLSWQDAVGAIQTAKYTGLAARVILHEYDHMEGVSFVDHASNFKLRWTFDRWKKKQIKQLRRTIINNHRQAQVEEARRKKESAFEPTEDRGTTGE